MNETGEQSPHAGLVLTDGMTATGFAIRVAEADRLGIPLVAYGRNRTTIPTRPGVRRVSDADTLREALSAYGRGEAPRIAVVSGRGRFSQGMPGYAAGMDRSSLACVAGLDDAVALATGGKTQAGPDDAGAAALPTAAPPRPRNGRVIVGLASYPPREEGMLAVVAALSLQCDEMHVALNEYEGEDLERVLGKLSVYPNVHARAYVGEEDLGCQNKFRAVDLCGPDDYFLTVDDDLLYPADYVSTMIAFCKSYDGLSVVSLHGWTMRTSNGVLDVSNPRDTTFLAIASVDSAVPVHVNSNNTMCCSPDRIGLSFDAFMFPKNTGDDECLAVFRQKHGIPGFVVPHKNGWVRNQHGHVFMRTALYLNRESMGKRIKWLHDMWDHWGIIIPDPDRRLRFSVITPAYNDSAQLARCLASVNNQTFDKNRMEMLVVDDTSNDAESRAMMRECEKYRFVKYTRLPERRMAGGARNEGLRISGDSDYIVFLDSDDVLFSNDCLERLDRFIRECDEPDVVLCGFKFNTSKKIRTFSANSVEQMAEKQCVAPWIRVSKKDKTPPFIENRRMLNDVVQFLRQLDIVKTVRSFDAPFIVYMNDNKNSCWHSRAARYAADALSAMFLVGSDIISEPFSTEIAKKRAKWQLGYEYKNHMKKGVANYNG